MCWRFGVVCCMTVFCDRCVGLDVRCMLILDLLRSCVLELIGLLFFVACVRKTCLLCVVFCRLVEV